MSQRAIKRIALITMVIDHIGAFIPGMPMWFRYIGRISAPLFFFCCAWGFEHTHSKEKFILRLYIAGIVMEIGNLAVYHFFAGPRSYDPPDNGIFTTLFVGTLICYLWEKKKYGFLILYGGYHVALMWIFYHLDIDIPVYAEYMLVNVFAPVLYVEGGIMCVLLFCALYRFKDCPILLAEVMLCYTYVVYKGSHRYWNNAILHFDVFNMWDFQYLAIFSLIIMLLYNGKKGKGCKYFYYIFYPAHVWILYVIGQFMGSR